MRTISNDRQFPLPYPRSFSFYVLDSLDCRNGDVIFRLSNVTSISVDGFDIPPWTRYLSSQSHRLWRSATRYLLGWQLLICGHACQQAQRLVGGIKRCARYMVNTAICLPAPGGFTSFYNTSVNPQRIHRRKGCFTRGRPSGQSSHSVSFLVTTSSFEFDPPEWSSTSY